MLSLQTLELCPYPCMSWNASRVLWKVIIFISFSKHKNSGLFFWEKKLWIATSYPFLTLEFSPILHNMAILVLFFLTLEFLPYPSKHRTSKHRNSDLILPNIGILTLSFQTLEFLSCPSKHWNSDLILLNIEILLLSFQTLEFWSYPCKH